MSRRLTDDQRQHLLGLLAKDWVATTNAPEFADNPDLQQRAQMARELIRELSGTDTWIRVEHR